MARARNIKPSFFFNEDLVELDYEYRLMFIGMWTLADREGRLENRPKKIKMNIFPADNVDVKEGLRQLEQYGFIETYSANDTDVIYIPNFTKHQTPHGLEKDSELPDKNGFYTVYKRTKSKTVTGKPLLVDKDGNPVSGQTDSKQLDNGSKTVSKQFIEKEASTTEQSDKNSNLLQSNKTKGCREKPLYNSYETVSKPLRNALNPDSLNPDSLNPESKDNNSLSQNAREKNFESEQICEQKSQDINDWQPPDLKTMQDMLTMAGCNWKLTQDEYDLHVSDYKAHYAEQALIGKGLVTEAKRASKLRQWLQNEYNKNHRPSKTNDSERFNIDNEDWGEQIFDTSQETVEKSIKRDPSKSVMLNGVWFDPLPGMSVQQTYEHIKKHQEVGESQDETYQRILSDIEGAEV